MNEPNFMNEVLRRAKTDEWYQLWNRDAEKLEFAFYELRDSLPEAQQQLLDDYINTIEGRQGALSIIAYHLGREQG
ncbi:MAG: hypothetical protein IJ001_03280 [Oscillospiraceae bacterium]|nr:hypothetical protein [Oscillospiraceae bacterium]